MAGLINPHLTSPDLRGRKIAPRDIPAHTEIRDKAVAALPHSKEPPVNGKKKS